MRVLIVDDRPEASLLALQLVTKSMDTALTGNAVTDQQLNTLTAEMKRIDAAFQAFVTQSITHRDSDTKARHDLREEIHAMLREMERRLEGRLIKPHDHT